MVDDKDIDGKIQVVIPSRGESSDISSSLAKTISGLEAPDVEEDYTCNVQISYKQPVDANRNSMVMDFLDDPENEWLYMNDDDVVPPTDILDMVKFGKPVVSGTVCIRKNVIPQPVLLRSVDGTYRQVNLAEYEEDKQSNGLIEVDGVGTGCLLVHRSVLEGMEPPWFKFQYDEFGRLSLGEDLYFSRKLEEAGVPMFVSTEHLCRHYKTLELSEVASAVNDIRKDAFEKGVEEGKKK